MRTPARALASLALLGLALAPVARPDGAAAAPSPGDDGGAVVLILDASGSMRRTDDNGTVLIDGAKRALTRLVDGLPDGSPVGLVVYGHREPNTDKTRGCQDTELVVPVGPLDRAGMQDAIAAVRSSGFTPIGRALTEAAAALPGGRGSIILVSDGEDTCAPPDPCEVAIDLVAQGVDVRVHTVGFFLGDEDVARTQLRCIADATGATYRDVDDIDRLATELGILVQEELPEGPQRVRLPLDGALSLAEAPLIPLGPDFGQPDNMRADLLGAIRPGETRWYAIDVVGTMGLAVNADVAPLVPGSAAGDVVSIKVVDEALFEYQAGSSRFGREEIELVTVDEPAEANLGTTASFSGFDVPYDSNDREILDVLGYDPASYDAAVRELLTRPAPPPVRDGRYYIRIEWAAAPSDDERVIDVALAMSPHADVKHLVYRTVEGALEPAQAPPLVPSSEHWFALPDIDLRGGYTGPIAPGETRWYQVSPAPDADVFVRAFLNRPIGAEAVGSFAVELHDAAGRAIGLDRDGYERTLPVDDPGRLNTFMLPFGLAPRPLVGVAGAGAGADGVELISFTWDGPSGESAQLEFVVDVSGGLRALGDGPLFLAGSGDWLDAPAVDIPPCVGEPPHPEYCLAIVAPIQPGESLWYRVDTDDWAAVLVNAQLFRALGTPVGAVDEFRVEILQPDGGNVATPTGRPTSVDLHDPEAFETFGDEIYASVGAANVLETADARGGPGTYYVGLTWNSDIAPVEAELHLMLELSPEASLGPETEATDDDAPEEGREVGDDTDNASSDPPDELELRAPEISEPTAGDGGPADGDAASTDELGDDGDSGRWPWYAAAFAAVLAVAAVGAAALARRRAAT